MLEKSDLRQIREAIQEEIPPIIEKQLIPIKKDIKALGTSVRKIQKDINMVIDTFDETDSAFEKRVKRIELKVGIVD